MLRFIPAKNFYSGRRRSTRLIVIHTTQTPCKVTFAERVANFFKRQSSTARIRSSAHTVHDPTDIVQCVSVGDTAWAAPKANADGIHMEVCGYAHGTPWNDPEPHQTLVWTACQAAMFVGLLRFLGVPFEVRRLAHIEVRDGVAAGFCGHDDVTAAFKTKGGHLDPGPYFPWDEFLGMVQWWISEFDSKGWPEANYR